MKKIIVLGGCGLDIICGSDRQPLGSMPSGRLVNAAAMLARRGLPVSLVGDTGDDQLGLAVVDHLSAAGVDISSVDRYVDGLTPVTFFFGDSATPYRLSPSDGAFDVVWPRIDSGDILLFGGYYAIDPAIRKRLMAFLTNAVERNLFVVYLPGFMPQLEPRLTRVMPAILENLEMASLVITRTADLSLLYGKTDPERCFNEHISYYSPAMVNIDVDSAVATSFCGKSDDSAPLDSPTDTLLWNSAAIAAITSALYRTDSLQPSNLSIETLKAATSQINAFVPSALAAYQSQWQLCH